LSFRSLLFVIPVASFLSFRSVAEESAVASVVVLAVAVAVAFAVAVVFVVPLSLPLPLFLLLHFSCHPSPQAEDLLLPLLLPLQLSLFFRCHSERSEEPLHFARNAQALLKGPASHQ
jgi:hypothetical protein